MRICLLALALVGCKKSSCEASSDYQSEECGIPQFADSVAADCEEGSQAECLAECDLEAECDVLKPPPLVDPNDQTELQSRTEAYEACQEACEDGA